MIRKPPAGFDIASNNQRAESFMANRLSLIPFDFWKFFSSRENLALKNIICLADIV